MKVSRSIVPSFFTVGNMFCGFFSVIAAFNQRYELAAWMIFAAAFLDTMDGKVARFTKSASKFGVEYDSLADVISFGFAPSFLIFSVYLKDMKTVGILISFLPLLFGSIRLARFNTQLKGFSKDYFKGLPIPIAALTLTSFIIFSLHFFEVPVQHPQILLLLIGVVSILMVSNVHYEIMPNFSLKGSKKDRIRLVLFLVAAILILYSPQMLFFPFIVLYILSGPTRWIYSFFSAEEINSES
ncbi:CDP-diacylglycerol--serine O-phosphatidyltransferase [Calditrichota bacterium]